MAETDKIMMFPEENRNTIIHEAKHVQSHICKYYNVREDGEQAAYLIGYLTMKMFKVFKNLIRNERVYKNM